MVHMDEGRLASEGPRSQAARVSTQQFLDNAAAVTELLVSGILPRFPALRFVAVEAGVGWVPFVLEAADMNFRKEKLWEERPEFEAPPSDYFRRQVYTTFWFENLEPHHVEHAGIERILFETDYPHPVCLDGGQIKEVIETSFRDVSAHVKERVLWKNAADLYGIEVPLTH